MKIIELIYKKALELRKIDSGKTQRKYEFYGFEFVSIHPSPNGDIGAYNGASYVKIMKKDIGFTFKIMKDDKEDIRRIDFVYNVTVACDNNFLLLPLAKKIKPDFRKIQKKFPSITKEEYQFDIHDKNKTINFIKKCLSSKY